MAFGLYWPWALWMLRRRGETVVITGSSEDWTGGRHGYLLFYADHHGDHHLIRTSDLFRRAGKAGRKGKVSPLPDSGEIRVVYDRRRPKRARLYPLDWAEAGLVVYGLIPAVPLVVVAVNL
ncbi:MULTISPECIES: hypothetical protein [unclassified Streptomyces]|uniref:hypothetical protein n=1 Tax=unclassified Streptomyces TaxID=2593676 RepID=UPI0022568530|nr:MULTISPECIES: hypothetical protein [unclassified Streptomyces]MCX4644065.1 hypothetical protein [Streptomyces sp. NBC_01446]MCX5325177.1 hypothetical protein [Streptomyces sp. NBC_00120]